MVDVLQDPRAIVRERACVNGRKREVASPFSSRLPSSLSQNSASRSPHSSPLSLLSLSIAFHRPSLFNIQIQPHFKFHNHSFNSPNPSSSFLTFVFSPSPSFSCSSSAALQAELFFVCCSPAFPTHPPAHPTPFQSSHLHFPPPFSTSSTPSSNTAPTLFLLPPDAGI
ncbi:hypothetical protein BDY24DRAFT_144924 [Mrakia frigida]|uniref:uncharacterized protein n=1 Tax=Mrakia frigida TaxID=29902 RepID=UPI003FCC1605